MTNKLSIAIIGYGRMGKEIEKIAVSRGHEIVARIDPAVTGEDFSSPNLSKADVAIEFTIPEVAVENYMECFKLNLPIVSGTTGWLDRLDEVKKLCSEKEQTLFYASNFSIGVNILFELNKYLAGIMNTQPDYEIRISETHHTKKLDAPSGTAIFLANDIIKTINRKKKWDLCKQPGKDTIGIEAIRENEVPGTHNVKYESELDEITINHKAKSRRGFAMGAVTAAEFAVKNKGFLTMRDLLKF